MVRIRLWVMATSDMTVVVAVNRMDCGKSRDLICINQYGRKGRRWM